MGKSDAISDVTTSKSLYEEIQGECFAAPNSASGVVVDLSTDTVVDWHLDDSASPKTERCVQSFATRIFADNATIIGQMRSKSGDQTAIVEDLKAKVYDLTTERDQLRASTTALEAKISEQQGDAEKLNDDLGTYKQKIASLNASIAHLKELNDATILQQQQIITQTQAQLTSCQTKPAEVHYYKETEYVNVCNNGGGGGGGHF